MDTIQKYELTDFTDNEVHVEVDASVLTIENATEINEFWSNADGRLDECDGDVCLAVLRLAFVTIVGLMRSRGWDCINAEGADHFNAEFQQQEGWFDCGIKVTYANLPEIEFEMITARCVS